MKKSKKILLILFFIVIVAGIYFLNEYDVIETYREQYLREKYGDPIDISTGQINNAYFGINKENQEAKQTTKGINEALAYANKHNIEYVKLEYGQYLIDGVRQKTNEKSGIILPSNITLDLNGSTINQIENGSQYYAMITIYEQQNVKVINGILNGDKNEHDYSQKGTHEFGYGVSIQSGLDVQIYNLQINNMIGDGVFISDLPNKNVNEKIISKNIKIMNCYINECRRQGISVISGIDIKIENNQIINIGGTNPGALIDLENNIDGTQKVDNIYIANNVLRTRTDKIAIMTYNHRIYDVIIENNQIMGQVNIYASNGEVAIQNNTISGGKLQILPSIYYLEKVVVQGNQINNTEVLVNNATACFFINNQLEDSKITNYINNFYLLNNKMHFNTMQDFGYILENNSEQEENTCYIYGNDIFNCKQEYQKASNVTIIEDITEINEKLKENEIEGI